MKASVSALSERDETAEVCTFEGWCDTDEGWTLALGTPPRWTPVEPDRSLQTARLDLGPLARRQ